MRTSKRLRGAVPPTWLARLRMVGERNRTVLRYWLTFVALLGVFQASFLVGESFWAAADTGTARLLAWSLSLVGPGAEADGSVVRSSLGAVNIIRDCTGIYPLAIFISAVVAYPVSWRMRFLGIAAAVPAILTINQVRLVSLCYIGRWYPASLETMHMLVWQSLIVVLTVLLFLLWLVLAPRLDPLPTLRSKGQA